MAIAVSNHARSPNGTPRMDVSFSWYDWPLCNISGVRRRETFWRAGAGHYPRWVNKNGHEAPIAYQSELSAAWNVYEAEDG